jgi:hypothetical protein
MANYDEEYTLIDVVEAVQKVGVISLIATDVHNFLVLYDDWFDSDNYGDMIYLCEEIREDYTDPYAKRVFGKTAAELSNSEKEQMWSLESEGGIPMDDRRAIYELWSELAQNTGYTVVQIYDAKGNAKFNYGIRYEGDQHTGISFETERGEKPATIWFGEPLPVIPPTDGMVNSGWVNYYGETVTSTSYDDLYYSPTFKAVWEEPSATTDHTVYRQEGGKWVKKHEKVKEVYQNKGGQWVKVSPVDAQ